jgi:signal peptidase I
MTPNTKRKIIHYWRRQVRPILVLILVFTAFRSTFADWNDVPTGSMNPTIFDGDRIYVNKLAYGLKFPYTTWHLARWSGPQRGEIVVFYSPKPPGTRLVKRCVGVPGDKIKAVNGFLTINGTPIEYTPFHRLDLTQPQLPAGYLPPSQIPPWQTPKDFSFFVEKLDEHPHVVATRSSPAVHRMDGYWELKKKGDPGYAGEGEYFMVGDNRDNSADSRVFGPVDRDLILGRSSRVIFSLDYNNWWIPRGNRFFHGLN